MITKENITLLANNSDSNDFTVLPQNCLVHVCAWCVPPYAQIEIADKGFALSHGICNACKEHFFPGKQTNSK